MSKKYYWLKLPENFFEDKPLKKLRRIAGGDTYTVIYLKMLLKSLKCDGRIYYDGIEDTVAEEIALEIDEDPDNVLVTLNFLCKYGLMEASDEEVFLTQMPEMVGSETDTARRVRKSREKAKELQCNTETLQCNTDVTDCNTEIEKRKEIEIDKEKSEEKPKRKRFIPPTLEEVTAYCRERGNKVDAQNWHDYYSSNGWKVGKNPMKDWKSAVRTWERNGFSNSPPKQQPKAGAMFRDFEQRSYDYDDLQKKLGVFG